MLLFFTCNFPDYEFVEAEEEPGYDPKQQQGKRVRTSLFSLRFD